MNNRKILVGFVIAIIASLIISTTVFAVGVGEILTSPESGWTRFDNENTNFTYTGEGVAPYSFETAYDGTVHRLLKTNDKVQFNFVGTKLRIIGTVTPQYEEDIRIVIDGVEEVFSEKVTDNSGTKWMCLVYEKTGLENKEHTVEIYRVNDSGVNNNQVHFDAIDIDGELKVYNENPEPVVPTEPVVTGNALLQITLSEGIVKEYDLSMSEVTDFINWYSLKDNGSGDAFYIFEKLYNDGPFTSRNEYITFNSIIYFEVMEY